MRRVVACIPLMLCLPAAMCAKDPPPNVTFPVPPVEQMVCLDEPEAPAARGPSGRVTDEDAGAYMKALRGSWQNCHGKVQWLKDWIESLNKP